MIFRPRILALSLILGLTVTGCNKKADDSAAAAATGEVLPGSISDAMIDLDTSTASPPMAAVKAPAEKAGTVRSSEAAQEAAPAADTPAEPAAATAAESATSE